MTDEEHLRASLSYDPATGVFRWTVATARNVAVGDVAGMVDNQGYVRIGCRGRYCLAHRVAWLFMTGEWPGGSLDHINLNKSDNRWANLRIADPTQNNANWRARGTQPKGVSLLPSGRYQASIKRFGQSYYLGLFDTPEEAHAAYCGAAKVLFGEFARAA